jgi:hypothetical protein
MRALLVLAALLTIAAAIALSAQSGKPPTGHAERPGSPATTPTPAQTRTPAPPRLDGAAINRQDRTTHQHRAREARAYDTRPLLSRLPLERAGVRIGIAGLAADDHTTVLVIDPGDRSRAHARNVYLRALRAVGDSGQAYVLEWAR